MPDRTGQQIGNYKLLKLLGKGAFAEVWLGEHIHLHTPAALKVLQALDPEAKNMFLKEAKIIRTFAHSHIVRLLEYTIVGDTPIIIMDYAPNGSLRKHRPGEIVPLPTVINYLKQIAGALDYAHTNGIIHRDLKPENMLLGRNNEVLLSDFGVAAAMHSVQSMRTGRFYAGTPVYSAPEQHLGHPVPASDQYAMGAIVYEWLSGTLPFTGSSYTEIAMKHVSEPPQPLHQRVSGMSPAIGNAVMKTLAKDPVQRFGTVREFAEALEAASQARGIVPAVDVTKLVIPPTLPVQAPEVKKPKQKQPEPVPEAANRSVPPAWRTEQPALQTPIYSSIPVDVPRTTHRVSRRNVLTGLAAVLALAGGGTAWWKLSNRTSWHAQTSGTWQYLEGVAWSGSQFVAVGGFGNSLILTSPDGSTWTARNSGTSESLWGVAWSGSQSVAVGQNGTILTSPDGSTWAARNSGTSESLWGVAWSGSQFVVVGYSGTILTSPDGSTWTARNSGTSEILYGIAWSGSQFVVVGYTSTILTSPDGKTWTARNSGTSRNLDGIAWSGSQFVAVGDWGTILTSPDGSTWTAQTSGTWQILRGVVWSGSQFVAVGVWGTILTLP